MKVKKDGPYKHPLPEPEKKRDLIDPHLLDLINTHLLDLITTPLYLAYIIKISIPDSVGVTISLLKF